MYMCPQAMTFLYEIKYGEVSFKPLEHVQTGNIYIVDKDEGVCRLGGYENTLLGYRSKLYRRVVQNDYYSSIDVIMFGEWVWCVLSCEHTVLPP